MFFPSCLNFNKLAIGGQNEISVNFSGAIFFIIKIQNGLALIDAA